MTSTEPSTVGPSSDTARSVMRWAGARASSKDGMLQNSAFSPRPNRRVRSRGSPATVDHGDHPWWVETPDPHQTQGRLRGQNAPGEGEIQVLQILLEAQPGEETVEVLTAHEGHGVVQAQGQVTEATAHVHEQARRVHEDGMDAGRRVNPAAMTGGRGRPARAGMPVRRSAVVPGGGRPRPVRRCTSGGCATDRRALPTDGCT